ncbi:MAG: hypothetical protein L0323_03975 [Planctomycetes bacterium]|nr:hypothetical protein [Planctomycetota bacterium]
MRLSPGMVSAIFAAGLALLPGSPANLAVHLEPPGCKPSPPFRLGVRAVPDGPRTCHVEVEVQPFLDARAVGIALDLPQGVACPESSALTAANVRAGERFSWRGILRLAGGQRGARILVHARVSFRSPDSPSQLEAVSALREIVLGDPPPSIPGRLVRSGGVETVEIPAVPLR